MGTNRLDINARRQGVDWRFIIDEELLDRFLHWLTLHFGANRIIVEIHETFSDEEKEK